MSDRERERLPGYENVLGLSLEDKLYRVRYEVDRDHPHIKVKEEVCRSCPDKVCTIICPARVYAVKPDDPSMINVAFENCLECGTCMIACVDGALDWNYPRGGFGVQYRFG